jgi:hypothetical protein
MFMATDGWRIAEDIQDRTNETFCVQSIIWNANYGFTELTDD